jgi:hypothetical protein
MNRLTVLTIAALLLAPLAAPHPTDTPDMPRTIIPAQSKGKAVPRVVKEKVYSEVKTPFKYGIVIRGEAG